MKGDTRPLEVAYARAVTPYLQAVSAIAREELLRQTLAHTGQVPRVGSTGKATAALASVVRGTQALADVLGRRDVLAAAKGMATRAGRGALPPAPPAAPPVAGGLPFPSSPGLPKVPFVEAVADVVAREPTLARTAGEVAAAYNEAHGFAAARAVTLEVTKKVQAAVARAIHQGTPTQALVDRLTVDLTDWTRAYAETVARTNMATAFSAGRFRQMAEPEVARVIGALRYDAVGDSDTRPNHAAADGLIAAPTDPVWQYLAPPLGFQCRCSLSFVDWIDLRRMGILLPDGRVRPATIPPGAHPDAGFRHTARPDVLIYGGSL